jgi:hypothetical protein
MPAKQPLVREEFLDLQRRLAEWRSSHPRRSPLPEQFWTEAAGLARKHGLYRTSRTLPIDYANLRKRLRSAAPVVPVPRLQFVELSPAPAGTGYCVEVLRVQSNGAVDWSQLLRGWRQSER